MSKSAFLLLLFLTFLVLKLCGVICWSWWWVTAPLWGVPVALIGFLAALLLFTWFLGWRADRKDERDRRERRMRTAARIFDNEQRIGRLLRERRTPNAEHRTPNAEQ